MANAATLAKQSPVRMMVAGYPGTAKTGALASLANMGYKIRMLDFDGNLEPLIKFTDPDKLQNIDVISFEDNLINGPETMKVSGKPQAFANALKAMDEWKYVDEQGNEVNLGKSKDWGCDTIVVLDTLTTMGIASFRRVQHLLNKTPRNTTRQVWGMAMAEQEAFIEKLTSSSNEFHVIVLSHLKMIGPKDISSEDDPTTKELKERVVDLTPTKFFPSALGQALPPVIGGHFPTLVLAESVYKQGKMQRLLNTVPRSDIDLKVPAPNVDATYPIETGLADLFKILAPPLDKCIEQAKVNGGLAQMEEKK